VTQGFFQQDRVRDRGGCARRAGEVGGVLDDALQRRKCAFERPNGVAEFPDDAAHVPSELFVLTEAEEVKAHTAATAAG